MIDPSALRRGLLLSTVLSSAFVAGAALAQEAGNAARTDGNALEEIVVTATRQTDTVNRVPLSITASTQRTLDQQGIRNITDLQATVPALSVQRVGGAGVATVAIRGIQQGGQGAATTGFYLDDTPLQKRNAGGQDSSSANGTPLPALFDLDRVEVLRGPQGTLFGGGSEGGTIRYITPPPSLTRYSSYARAEASTTKNGDPSYEAGIAVGGPIVQDKLGFRASVYKRHQGGFIDLYNPFTRALRYQNSNDSDGRIFRLAVTWAPVENAKITAAYFDSREHSDNNTTAFTLPTSSPIVVPTLCFNTNNTPTNVGTNTYVNGVNTAARGGPVSGLPLGSPLRLHPRPVAQGAAACAARAAAGDVTFTMPGYQLGPYDLKPYDLIATDLQPSTSSVRIGSLTVDYDFAKMSMKAITSYIEDTNRTKSYEGTQISNMHIGASYGGIIIPSGIGYNANYQAAGGFGNGNFNGTNQRYGLSQEIRFSSAGDAKPFSWVAGVFYSNTRGKQHWENNYYSLEALAQALYGITASQRYGVPGLGMGEGFDWKRQTLKDVEIAAFGEGNYWVTDRLRLTAGLRVSRVSFDYFNLFYGPVTSVAVPTEANGGTNSGSVAESPVTPKFSAQYQINDRDLVYITASKGFRAGGVNGRLSQGICGTALASYALTAADTPPTYKSDSVWSYEAGGKFRLFSNRVQLNGSIYQIDWNNVQVTTNPGNGCGLSFTINGKSARSRGFELEAQARLFSGLSANLAVGYTNAKYTDEVTAIQGRNGINYIAALKGQKFALPPWTVNVGARYEHTVAAGMLGYVRADWRYTSNYSTLPFGANGYSPDSANFPQRQTVNARLGVEYGDFDINIFANNLFNFEKGNISGGRTGCPLPAQGGTIACTGFTNYNAYRNTSWGVPRQVGIQIAYRH
jgi:outer membrane receptor protein involved in Fe transport